METDLIRKRFEALFTQRKTVESTWDVIERFITPYRGGFFQDQRQETSIDWRKREVYDSTAVMSHQNLAASLHGSITSPSIRWFDLTFQDEKMNDSKESKEWLEECSRITYDAIQESNFNLEVNETYQDICGYGTSVITEEPIDDAQWRGIQFASIPLKQCYFEQNWEGKVYRLYRLLSWTPIQIISKFGTKVPQTVMDAKDSQPDTKIDIIFCIFERPKYRPSFDAGGPGKKLAPKRRPYGFKYMIRSSGDPLGDEGGYYEMPAFVPRWRKTNDSMWGNSPAMIALADVLTLNQLIEMVLRSAEKVIDPPTLAEERTIISDLVLKAAGLTVVRDISKIRPFESGARFDVSQLRIEDLREAIQSYFFVDKLELKNSPAMTATEAQIRYDLMQRLLGPTLGRLQSDFLDLLIQRTFNMLYRAGQFPAIPESVKDGKSAMDIKYLGPLNRAQQVDAVAGVERWIATLGNIAATTQDQKVLKVPDYVEVAKGLGRMLTVPAKMMRDEKKVDDEVKADEERMEEMKEAAALQAKGDATQSVGAGMMSLQGPEGEGEMEQEIV